MAVMVVAVVLAMMNVAAVVMMVVVPMAIIVTPRPLPCKRHLDVGSADGVPAGFFYFYFIPFDAELLNLFYDVRRLKAQIHKGPDAHVAADSGKAVKVQDSLHKYSPYFLLDKKSIIIP